MQWLFGLILRYRTLFSLVATLSVSLYMIRLPQNGKVETASFFTTTIFYPVQFVVTQVKKARNIWQENKVLRTEVSRLNLENVTLRESALENSRLRQILNFKERTSLELIPAEVVAHNPGRTITSMILNVGSHDGVKRNMPVVGIRGVVGKTTSVLPFSCNVQLISDPNYRMSVMTQRSRVMGILESDEGIKFKMQVQEYTDVAVGDKVITSGLGGIFPKGLNVGTVEHVEMGKNNIFKEVFITLDVNFDYVEEVFVLKLEPLWQSDTTDIVREKTAE